MKQLYGLFKAIKVLTAARFAALKLPSEPTLLQSSCCQTPMLHYLCASCGEFWTLGLMLSQLSLQ